MTKKPNYRQEKRVKDLNRQKKQEEKRLRRQHKNKPQPEEDSAEPSQES